MNSQFLPNLESLISTRRLQAYTQHGDQDVDILAKYVWNMRLCETFCPSLQAMEIVLRNSMHEQICRRLNNTNWLRSSQRMLRISEQQMVADAESKLRSHNRVVDSDRLVAELSFGFWTSLFNTHYETQGLWPSLLQPVFPYAPRYMRRRSNISWHITQIRRFRNRIFHHETICFDPDLTNIHDTIIGTIDWISPEMGKVVRLIDGFTTVNHPSYLAELKKRLNSLT